MASSRENLARSSSFCQIESVRFEFGPNRNPIYCFGCCSDSGEQACECRNSQSNRRPTNFVKTKSLFFVLLIENDFLAITGIVGCCAYAGSGTSAKCQKRTKGIDNLSVPSSRCAPNIGSEDAKTLQSLIDAGAPPVTAPCQTIFGGPIGSGRTSMAAGIATEFAFKQNKVRYLGLDCLLEFATNTTAHVFPDDAGPTTISYWPWSQAQVVIIDRVGPLVASNDPGAEANVERFKKMLKNELGTVAGVLNRCHTVWVIGDLCPPPPRGQFGTVLNEFAKAVAEYCGSLCEPLVVELGLTTTAATEQGRDIRHNTIGSPRNGGQKRAAGPDGRAGH